MARLAMFLTLATLTAPAALASEVGAPAVILITVDGVRAQEVFGGLAAELSGGSPGTTGPPLLPRLRQRAAREGFLAGDVDQGDPFVVRNQGACSLPGYQSILAGQDTGCRDNRCGRIQLETVLERARRELGLGAPEVAAFASWPQIALAVERTAGSLTVNTGLEPFRPGWAPTDAATEAILRDQGGDLPPWPYRRDRHTWALAMRYLERFRPRVLYVALGDPDEWAHLGEAAAYAGSVRDLDDRLEALLSRLATMGEYGAGASVIVTTDHGRGNGRDWSSHGNGYEGSRRAWLFASTPATRLSPGRSEGGRYDHLSIRPTIEALLGLAPCQACQPPMRELLRDGARARLAAAGGGAGGGGP